LGTLTENTLGGQLRDGSFGDAKIGARQRDHFRWRRLPERAKENRSQDQDVSGERRILKEHDALPFLF
jgi:hypothetical protein